MQVFFRLAWFFRQEWRRYALAMGALWILGFILMFIPWLIGRVVDAIADGTLTPDQLYAQVGLMMLLGVVTYFLRVTWRVALFGASHRLADQLRQRIFGHLLQQGPAFYQQLGTGDLMARATNDIQAVEFTAGEAVLALSDGVFTGLLVLAVMMWTVSFPLTLIALLPWPIVGWVMYRFGKQLHVAFDRAQARFSDLNDQVQESVAAIRVTRAFGREHSENTRFGAIARAANRDYLQVGIIDSKYEPVIKLAVGSSFLLSVAGGAWLIETGQLTLGQLTSFSLYLGYLIWPMFAIGWLLNLVERGKAAYDRIDALLTIQPAIEDLGETLRNLSPHLQVDIARFDYDQAERGAAPLLEGVHFEVGPGKLVGLVGHTGAGKTTVVNLILRFEEHSAARIRLGGRSIRDLSLHSLRSHIAVVPQSPFLFSTSVGENIALARPEAARQQIEQAAELACIHKEILALPDGYDTQVGERGITLSGGQKQRIAIARALLQDAPLLILDDALSAVDVQTERAILDALAVVRKGRSTLIVCHRLTAVQTADLILVLQHGRLLEQGDHLALLAKKGWYSQIWAYQQLEHVVEAGL